jgi:hypothetical protein
VGEQLRAAKKGVWGNSPNGSFLIFKTIKNKSLGD